MSVLSTLNGVSRASLTFDFFHILYPMSASLPGTLSPEPCFQYEQELLEKSQPKINFGQFMEKFKDAVSKNFDPDTDLKKVKIM